MSNSVKEWRQQQSSLAQCARCGSSIKEPHYGEQTEDGEPLCIACAARPDHKRTLGSKLKERRPGSERVSKADLTPTQQDIVDLARKFPDITVSQAVSYLDVSDVYVRKTLREYHDR